MHRVIWVCRPWQVADHLHILFTSIVAATPGPMMASGQPRGPQSRSHCRSKLAFYVLISLCPATGLALT